MAEDDQLMSRMYGRMLKASGYNLQEAGDGETAIRMLKEMNPKPHVILLDVMMPNKNGFDVLRAVKEDDALKSIPVIMLSNLSGEEDAKKGLALGATSYMIKSEFSPKQIVDKIKEVLGQKS